MKINHNNKEYILDVERSLELGVLKEVYTPPPFVVGGVYRYNGANPFLLVEVEYGKSYQLLGMFGCSCNSNKFYHKVHSRDEILEFFKEKNMKFIKNISLKVSQLVG